MCFLSSEDKYNLSTLLWRFKTLLGRKKGNIVRGAYQIFLFMFMAILFRKLIPPINIEESDNFGNMITFGSAAIPDTDPDLPAEDKGKVSIANDCVVRYFNLIGLVDESGSEVNHAQEIWDILEGKMFTNQSSYFSTKVFDNTEALDTYQNASENAAKNTLCFALTVKEFDTGKDKYEVDIRFNQDESINTDDNMTDFQSGAYDIGAYNKTKDNGVQHIMSSVSEYITKAKNPSPMPQYLINLTPSYTTSSEQDPGDTIVYIFLNLALQLISIVGPLIGASMLDWNEGQIFGLSTTMGLKFSSVIFAIYAIMLFFVVVFWLPCWPLIRAFILPSSNMFILFLGLFLYSIAQVQGIVFYTKASGTGGIIFFALLQLAGFILQTVFVNKPLPNYISYPYSILCPGYGFGTISRIAIDFESKFKGEGLQWSNAMVTFYTNSVLGIMICMATSFVLMSILTLWLWPVFNSKEGTKVPLCYCCNGAYLRERRARREKFRRMLQQADDPEAAHELLEKDPLSEHYARDGLIMKAEEDLRKEGDFEVPDIADEMSEDHKYLGDTLRIHELFKQFKSVESKEMKPAVDKMSLSIYKNQILALLGHNGAGKTTTISMLTGFLQPTSGKARAFGLDVFEQRDFVDRIIGICPQHNVLISNMTVMENLFYFCRFRQMSITEIKQYADEMLVEVTLDKKKHSLVKTLSGGQKRKLQLIIAMAGNTKLVLLDEPSSGMDPTARRDTWNLIKKFKKGRIVILTTHYMDEADVLGDRIAIMSKGRLKCCGSSLFLKKKFGLGSILEIQQVNPDLPMTELEDLLNTYAEKAIELGESDLQKSNLKKIEGKIDESNSYVIKVPELISPFFTQIFKEVDADRARFNIQQYNMRVSSLEEVFNNIGEMEHKEEIDKGLAAENDRDLPFVEMQTKVVSDSEMYKIMYWRRKLIGERKKECMRGIFIPMVIALAILSTIVKQLVQSWPAISISNVNMVFAGKHGDPNAPNFKLAYSDNFDTTGGSISISQFIKQNEALSSLTTKQITDYEKDAKAKDTAASFSKAMSVELPQLDVGDRFNGGLFMAKQQKNDLELYIMANQSAPIAGQAMAGVALEAVLQTQLGNPNLNLTFSNVPLTPNALFAQAQLPPVNVFTMLATLFPFILMFSRSSLGSAFLEKETGVRKQLMLGGVQFKHFFWSSLVFDVRGQFFSCLLLWVYLQFVNLNVEGLWLPLLLFCIAQPVFNYFFLSMSKNKSAKQAQNILTLLSIICIFGGTGCAFLALQVQSTGADQYNATGYHISLVLEYILCILPNFAGTFAFIKIMYRAQYNKLNPVTAQNVNPWGVNGCLPELIALGASIVVYTTLAFAFENDWMSKGAKNDGIKVKSPHKDQTMTINPLDKPTDERVGIEAKRAKDILDGRLPKEQITVYNLQKYFQRFKDSSIKEDEGPGGYYDLVKQEEEDNQLVKAVKDISFSLGKHECFILLGVNGAGKSTTFKCLTAEEKITDGEIQIDDTPITDFYHAPEKMRNKVGYCPQTDPLIWSLTVKENLLLYSRIKGIPADKEEKFAEIQAKKFRVHQFFNTQAQSLSGGNKRKLCTAIAMLANPSVIYLDESSAGVDPYSRRLLWKSIRNESKNSALIVTTHSMEEAEALGTKMAIMVDGKFKCFGTSQEIKERFGTGFTVELKIDLDRIDKKYGSFTQNINSDIQKMISAGKTHSIEEIRNLLAEWFSVKENPGITSDSQKSSQDVGLYFQNEFSAYGLLASFYRQAEKGNRVDLLALLRQVININEIVLLIDAYEEEFGGQVTILDYRGNQVNLKLANSNFKSIGHLFGFTEDLKEAFPIKDYSATQTTLEQIFNSFAKEKAMDKFNRSVRKNSTLRGRRPPPRQGE